MEKFKRILNKLFFLPLIPTVLIAVPAFALMIFVMVAEMNSVIVYLSYGLSAYALIICCTGVPKLIRLIQALRKHDEEHPLAKKFLRIPMLERLLTDVRFRTEVSLYGGMFINLLYIAIKMFSGIYYRSFWFIALAVYYILLALMRFLLLRRGKRKTERTPMQDEIHRYRLCGIVLLVMNQALMGIVVFMVQQNQGFDYPGLLIYAMAAYSFYSAVLAIVNLVRYRKHGSPVLSAAKAINLVAAMVSILSLETAMLAQFGGDDEVFRAVMTGATGGGVCTIVIGMAVYMIWRSSKLMKNLQINNSQT